MASRGYLPHCFAVQCDCIFLARTKVHVCISLVYTLVDMATWLLLLAEVSHVEASRETSASREGHYNQRPAIFRIYGCFFLKSYLVNRTEVMKSRTPIETGWQASEAINLTNGDDLLLIFVNLTLE